MLGTVELLPAAGISPCCLHSWSWLKLQLIKEELSARLDEWARHYCQGLQYGGRNTPPYLRFSSPPKSKKHHYLMCIHTVNTVVFQVLLK